jgi:hypothetical protein
MNPEPPKSNIVLIVIAVIGVVGTIVASAIGAIANYNIEKLRQESELTKIALVSIATQGSATQASLANTISAPTGTLYPTNAPLPTYTSYPTYTPPLLPTIPSLPSDTPTPLSDLPLGQGYTANRVRIVLRDFCGSLCFYLTVYNDRQTTLVFSTYYSYARLYDDLGNEYRNSTSGADRPQQYNVYPGGQDDIGNFGQISFSGPVDPNANYLISSYDELLDLKNLTWKISLK